MALKKIEIRKNELFERGFYDFQCKGLSVGKVFDDYIRLTTITLLNQNPHSVKNERREEREKEYLQIVGNYQKELVNVFPQIFADMIELMENGNKKDFMNGGDYIGHFFEKNITYGQNGQFFTPNTITEMLARVVVEPTDEKITINDPACGSGRTLLSALKLAPNAIVFGCDIDRRCTQMATLNLFLTGATGYTFHMDTLAMKIYGGYKFGIKFGVPYLFEMTKEEAENIMTPPMRKQAKEATPPEAVERINNKGKQISLFG